MLQGLQDYNTNKIACGVKPKNRQIKDRAIELLRAIKPFPKCSVAKKCMDHVGTRCDRDDFWDAAIEQATLEQMDMKETL